MRIRTNKAFAGILCAAAVSATGAAVTSASQTVIPVVNSGFNMVYQSQANYQASLSNPSVAVTGDLAGGIWTNGWGTTTFSGALTFSDGSSSTSGYVPGWTGTGGEQNFGATTTAPNPRSGGDYAWANGADIFSQTLGASITPGATYLLTAGIDNRYSGDTPVLQLTAGGTAISGASYFGIAGNYRQAPNTVAELVTAPAGASGALGITLGNAVGSGGQAIFNNVQLVENPTSIPTIVPPVYNNGLTINNLGGSAAAVVVGPADQSNLNPTGTVSNAYNNNPAGNTINYYTNNGAPPGQTFTTGTAQAYTLNSVTVLDQDEHGGFADNALVTLDISSVSGSNYSLIAVVSGTVAVGTSTASGDYMQLVLNTPITLQGGKQYGFSVASNTGYSGLAADSNNDYAGGTLADFQPGMSPTGTLQTNTALPSSVFDVSLTATPEPASLSLLLVAAGLMLLARRRVVKA